ncbi:hypothetical protein ACLOJK_030825 [Asimina triloba]
MPPTRHRPSKRPPWIIILVSLVCLSLIGAYVYPPRHYAACYLFASSVCSPFKQWLPPVPARLLTDEEMASQVVIKDILNTPPRQMKNPKIAFMFLTPGSLPFEKLWEQFFLVIGLLCFPLSLSIHLRGSGWTACRIKGTIVVVLQQSY